MPDLEIAGLRIAYEQAGEGPPLVLLHGYVGDGASTWRAQLDGLRDAFTVVALDLPGAGGSADPPESWSLADFADCLAGFLSELGLERPHVGGLSWGGGLALELYRRHPELPRTLILASAYAGWAGSLSPEELAHRLLQVEQMADLAPERFVSEVAPTMVSASVSGPLVDAFIASTYAFHPSGLRAMARSFAAADLRDALPGIEVPVLLLYGENDVRAPRSVGEALHAAMPDSRLVLLEGAGHLCNLEAAERFNAEVRAFLRSG